MNSETPFSEFADVYLCDIKGKLKSFSSIFSIMSCFKDYFKKTPIGQLKRIQVHFYIKQRKERGICDGTINTELAILSAAIGYVSDRWELDLPNPVKRQRLPAPEYRVRYLSHLESERLIDAASTVHPLLSPFLVLALNTGCRKTELVKLKWDDIDFDRRVITLRPENTKTRKRRAVPMNAKTMIAFNELLNLRGKNRGEDQWVFFNGRGGHRRDMYSLFVKARTIAGIEDCTLHDLRHTFASRLVMSGVELIKVRDLLGHSSVKMTERYAHLATDVLFGAVSVLDRY